MDIFSRVRGGGLSRERWWQRFLFAPTALCSTVVKNGSDYFNAALLLGLKVSQCSVKIFPMDTQISKCHGQISHGNMVHLQNETIDKPVRWHHFSKGIKIRNFVSGK